MNINDQNFRKYLIGKFWKLMTHGHLPNISKKIELTIYVNCCIEANLNLNSIHSISCLVFEFLSKCDVRTVSIVVMADG